MMGVMMHEPSYKSGTYVNEDHHLYVGWVTHDGSFADCMPVWNEAKNICLIFSGEHFADQSEIAELRSRGHAVEQANASYLVHLYEEKGLKFIEMLNGSFSGVLMDLREKKITMFNDRYGLGRIYYHEDEERTYFASEAKSLLRAKPELRRLNYQSLAETFSCGCVLQNRTLFAGVELLPGGSAWTFSRGDSTKKERYFNLRQWEDQPPLDRTAYYARLKETYAQILPRYFQGQRSIAMSLTGGLDGRMIMAWSKKLPEELPCYTFGGSYRDCSDVKIARKVAKQCRQQHETIVVGPQFLSEFAGLAAKAVYVSDGTMDVTGSVELYVNRIARQIAPVRLTGNYGSEILRGNIAFRPTSVNEMVLEPAFARLVHDAAVKYHDERRGHATSFIAFKQVPWHHYSRFSVEQSQITPRTPYLDNDLVSLVYQAPPESIMNPEPALRLIADGNAALAMIPTDRGQLYQPIPLITKCRHYYEEFTFKAEYAYDYGMPPWLARIDHNMSLLHIENMFLGRHKFYHFRVWYRDVLSKYVKDFLLDPRTLTRPYLNGSRIEKIVLDHTAGRNNHTLEIHRLLTCELIQRHLIEMCNF
jgi:asparagine synthase (glutamine-hydrolysing)